MDKDTRAALALRLGQIACEAGKIILAADRASSLKPDGSPVTAADRASEQLIRAQLQTLDAALPVIAEESFDAVRQHEAPRRFALIDPLDGTREFIAGRDEFTVNLAVIEDGAPAAAAVYAPARRQLYLAGAQAFRVDAEPGSTVALGASQPLRTRAYPPEGLAALVSRSHLDDATHRMIDRLPLRTCEPTGSSLKFCLIAEGRADVYPRLSPTMEWDTAAGHAVLVAAGGQVVAPDGSALTYGKPGLRNLGFVAWGRAPLAL